MLYSLRGIKTVATSNFYVDQLTAFATNYDLDICKECSISRRVMYVIMYVVHGAKLILIIVITVGLHH